MSSSEQKLDQILQDLDIIKKALRIVPDREYTVTNYTSSLNEYENYAISELSLEQTTIENQRSVILRFLEHSKGKINPDAVKAYLDSNNSSTWKTNQIKALRRYVRDFLKLGSWIEQFRFKKESTRKRKAFPTNSELADFCNILPEEIQPVFLVLLSSGLRIGEVLGLKIYNFDLEYNMVDASEIHTGMTKYSRFSFITSQASDMLFSHIEDKIEEPEILLFSVSARTVQQAFKEASETLKIDINPHLLRKVFTDRCEKAGIEAKHIDALCGRTPQTVLDRHYTDYSKEALRLKYDKVEELLTLPL